jgi:hypothetical protein
MNTPRLILPLLLLSLLAAPLAPAQNFSSYRVISQRNIFNQHRVPVSRATPTPVVRTTPRTTTDAFSLVGTLVYEKGRFAFFDGTSPDYRKVAQPSDTIAGYKITAILPHSVQLESGGKQFEMKVGTQLRRYGDTVELTAAAVTPPAPASAAPLSPTTTAAAAPGSPPSSSAATAGAPSTATGSSPSDILKKLMEKRAQEMR